MSVKQLSNEKPTRTRWIVAFMMWAAIAINF